MPYQQRTPRRIRRHVITYSDVCRANDATIRELDHLGFWSKRLDKVEVYWTRTSLTYYGWYEGHIHIPAISGAHLSDYFHGRHMRLADILRHEWAHAVADKCPELIDTRRFVREFGAAYEFDGQLRDPDPDHHVTAYASTMPCEDFAEVFHFYLRHKGRLPVRFGNKPKIVRKWAFIQWMAERISRAA